jgi:protein SCO1/2
VNARPVTLRFVRTCAVTLALALTDHVAAGWGPAWGQEPSDAGRPAVTYRGGLVTPPLPKPRFTLTDTTGAPYDFWERTQGHVTLLFFGYTRCPDQCPLHMANIAASLKKMRADSVGQIQVVFVTTDPARDSPQVLRSWLDHFDARFVGLTGSEAAIEVMQRVAGLSPARKIGPTAGNYAVGHASFVFAYTKDNLAHLIYPSGVTERDWTHDLPLLVHESWSSH